MFYVLLANKLENEILQKNNFYLYDKIEIVAT